MRIYDRSKSEHLVKMMTAVGILILAISIGQGTFGRYLNGDIKKSFKAPELFRYAVAMKNITQILHYSKIASNKKWLILTRDDLIKNTVYNTLGYDRFVVVNVDRLSTNDVVSVCRSL